MSSCTVLIVAIAAEVVHDAEIAAAVVDDDELDSDCLSVTSEIYYMDLKHWWDYYYCCL